MSNIKETTAVEKPVLFEVDARVRTLADQAVQGIRAARNRVELMHAQQDADIFRRIEITQNTLRDLVQKNLPPALAQGVQYALEHYEADTQRLTAELRGYENNLQMIYQRLAAVRLRLDLLRGQHATAAKAWQDQKDAAIHQVLAGPGAQGLLGRWRGGSAQKTQPVSVDLVDAWVALAGEIVDVASQEATLTQEKLRTDERILKIRADLVQRMNQAASFVTEQVNAAQNGYGAVGGRTEAPTLAPVEPRRSAV